MLIQIETGDRRLLDSVAATMAEAARRSGAWLACRLGCTQCCIGPFAITQLDAWRLRRGLAAMEVEDPSRAAAVRARAAAYVEVIASSFPGDPSTAVLEDEDTLPESMKEAPCPALDPVTGACELYVARPITCRSFGPATRTGDESIAACELCYESATEEQMIACAVEVDPDGLEDELLAALDCEGAGGKTLVAYALLDTNP